MKSPTKTTSANVSNVAGTNAKRRKIPAWLREELGRIEKEKEKKMQNSISSNNSTMNNNTNHSLNESFSVSDCRVFFHE